MCNDICVVRLNYIYSVNSRFTIDQYLNRFTTNEIMYQSLLSAVSEDTTKSLKSQGFKRPWK